MEKEKYLRYFNNNKKNSSNTLYQANIDIRDYNNNSRKGHKNNKKILPHISQQYEFKITNHLLLQKIINPKRDKTITQNFNKTSTRDHSFKNKYKESEHSNEKIKSLDREYKQNNTQSLSLLTKIRQRKNINMNKIKQIQKQHKNYQIVQQNHRMGKRIIDTRSCVQELLKKTFFTYKSHNHKKSLHEKQNNPIDLKNSYIKGTDNKKYYLKGKINNGVKVFFNPIENDSICDSAKNTPRVQQIILKKSNTFYQQSKKQNEQESYKKKTYYSNKRFLKTTSPKQSNRNSFSESDQQKQFSLHIQTNFPQAFKVFGRGPTILMIHNLEINCNPQLKADSMLALQLITHQKKLNYKKSKQKTLQTLPIIYEFFRSKPNCIKFAINVSQIGDFVPLRIYRISGNQMIQMGIIDIDLSIFKYRKEAAIQQSQNFIKQIKHNCRGIKMEREILSSQMKGNLRRRNLLNKNCDIQVKLEYNLYSKKFRQTQS